MNLLATNMVSPERDRFFALLSNAISLSSVMGSLDKALVSSVDPAA